MHAKIYQISRERLNADEFITMSDLTESDMISCCADYFDDVNENEYDDLYQWVGEILSKAGFLREGDALIYQGAERFMQEWVDAIKAAATVLETAIMKKWMPMYRLKNVIDNTHLGINHRFYMNEECMSFGEFMRDVFADLNPGDKLYLGGIVDFHY